jgi:hypothetical protein
LLFQSGATPCPQPPAVSNMAACCFRMVRHRVRSLRLSQHDRSLRLFQTWPPVVSERCDTVSAASGCFKHGRLLFPNGATPCPVSGASYCLGAATLSRRLRRFHKLHATRSEQQPPALPRFAGRFWNSGNSFTNLYLLRRIHRITPPHRRLYTGIFALEIRPANTRACTRNTRRRIAETGRRGAEAGRRGGKARSCGAKAESCVFKAGRRGAEAGRCVSQARGCGAEVRGG